MKWLSYPRAILMSLFYPFFLVTASLLAVLQNLIVNDRQWDNWVIRTWGRASCRMFGVNIQASGLENIPKGGCLFVFNHTSFFDVFALAAVLPSLRFGAKIELFKIPVFGRAMRRMGILPIDRRNRERVFNVYKEAEERLAKGERFALAPEGTRQHEEKLGPFKAGPFVFAINTKAPVVPVVIKNASTILPKHSVLPNWGEWRHDIQVIILPAVSSEGYTVKDRPILQEKVRDEMQPYFPGSNQSIG